MRNDANLDNSGDEADREDVAYEGAVCAVSLVEVLAIVQILLTELEHTIDATEVRQALSEQEYRRCCELRCVLQREERMMAFTFDVKITKDEIFQEARVNEYHDGGNENTLNTKKKHHLRPEHWPHLGCNRSLIFNIRESANHDQLSWQRDRNYLIYQTIQIAPL